MNKDVIISVKGSHTDTEQETNVLELVTEGKYYKKDNAYYVTYKESEVTGMEGTTTTLRVSGDTVTLIRFGSVNSHFVFQQGQRHMSYYDTEHGAFTISVFTTDMEVRVDDSGGEIHVDYQLEIDNNKTGENNFYMWIREAGHQNDQPHGGHKTTGQGYC